MCGKLVKHIQGGEENSPGPKNVREPIYQLGQELVCQSLNRLVGVVELDQQDLRMVLQLKLPGGRLGLLSHDA